MDIARTLRVLAAGSNKEGKSMGITLKDVYEKVDDIPESFRELYSEKGGKFELTGISGVRTSADVARIEEALRKEKNDHKATKQALSTWGELKHEDVIAKLDRFEELEQAAKGKLNDDQIAEMVNKRVEATLKSRLAPIEREREEYKRKLEATTGEVTNLKSERRRSKLHSEVRKLLTESKAEVSAFDDACLLADMLFEESEDGKLFVTKDNALGFTPGQSPASFLAEAQTKRAHWWPPSQGGGAPGSRQGISTDPSKNPWTAEGWNMTAQAKVYRGPDGPAKAAALAKAAGTTVGGPRPKSKK